jgi:hypothetical protein
MKDIFKTGDRLSDFVIENYGKVKDFLACYEAAQYHYPNELEKTVKGWLEADGYNQPMEDGYSLWFADVNFYDRDFGIYYYIGDFLWSCLEENNRDNCICIALVVEKNKSHKFNKWLNTSIDNIKKSRNSLRAKGIYSIGDQGLDSDDLARMYLDDILHLDYLTKMSHENLKSLFSKKVKTFTEILTGSKGIVKPFFE